MTILSQHPNTGQALRYLWGKYWLDGYTELRQKLTFCTRVKMLICAAAEYS